ncbi:MAG: phosphotransferase [Proteobacteria bacterium]|nr:phosphotransferase [Pseudomonadota bacterium]
MSSFDDKLDRIVRAHISGCDSLVSAERLTGGASQETYRVIVQVGQGQRQLAMRRSAGGQFLSKRPVQTPAGRASPGLEGEALLMGEARKAGVPAPEVYYVLTEEDDLGDGFIMEWLEGEALGARIVRDDAFAAIRPKLAYECGRVLGRIHGIDVAGSGLATRLQTTPPLTYVTQTWDRYRALKVPQPMLDYAGRWLVDQVPTDFDMALVHNDFRNGNFMVDSERIIGVLDWELAHIGDPMRDLGWVCTNAWRFGGDLPVGGFGSYEDLFRGYEEVTGKPVDADRVHYWEVFGCFWWAVTCLHMAEQFRHGPDRSIERAMIGRRTSEAQMDCANLLLSGPIGQPAAPEAHDNLEMPRADELLVELEQFLRGQVMAATTGRIRFLTRVAANAVGVVLREHEHLARYRNLELESLQDLLGSQQSDLETLRWSLVNQLRNGDLALTGDALKRHLWTCAVQQIQIDNPRYSGLAQARAAVIEVH